MSDPNESTPITTDPPHSPGTPEPPDLDVDAREIKRKVDREHTEEAAGQEQPD